MKKEQFLLIIVAIILVAAIVLRVVQVFDKQKEGVKVLVPAAISEPIATTSIKTSNPIISSATTTVEQIPVSTSTAVLISQPLPNETISSPVEIIGQAPGNWFFEASLPVKLITLGGEEIAAHYALAQSNWMTDELVPFKSTLEFTTTATSGYLVIANDNPSGLPENSLSFKIPVNF
jgi:hypothetical protein